MSSKLAFRESLSEPRVGGRPPREVLAIWSLRVSPRSETGAQLWLTSGARPRGPMDTASAYRAGGCRFEACRGHLHCAACHDANEVA